MPTPSRPPTYDYSVDPLDGAPQEDLAVARREVEPYSENPLKLIELASTDPRPHAVSLALHKLAILSIGTPLDDTTVKALVDLQQKLGSRWHTWPLMETLGRAAANGAHAKVVPFLENLARRAVVPNTREYAISALGMACRRSNQTGSHAQWQMETAALVRQLVLAEPENYVRYRVAHFILLDAGWSPSWPGHNRELFPSNLVELAEQWLLHTQAEDHHRVTAMKVPNYFPEGPLAPITRHVLGTGAAGNSGHSQSTAPDDMTQKPIEQTLKSIKAQMLASSATIFGGVLLFVASLFEPSLSPWIGGAITAAGLIWRFVVVPGRKWWQQG